MRIIILLMTLLIGTSVSVSAFAFGGEGAVLSVSLSLIPDEANQDVDNIPGSQYLDDSAYQYNISYTWKAAEAPAFGHAEFGYIALRIFKFIGKYTEDESDGASELEGLAILYGQRYMLTQANYNGLGFGWYAGVAIGDDTYVEQGFNTTPITEDLLAPLAAGELFYRYSADHFFIEANAVVALNKDTNGVIFVPALLAGFQF